ncbi:diphosphate synthase [Arthrobacter sp. Hiyo4]|nr:diphosphate synthase [Arthrobacter sp. Hiyo4]
MTNSADHSWTHAGHGLPDSEPSLNTTAIATGLQLPAGFAAIAEDSELGPPSRTTWRGWKRSFEKPLPTRTPWLTQRRVTSWKPAASASGRC